jgi:alkylhydroperoxidase family enzyme
VTPPDGPVPSKIIGRLPPIDPETAPPEVGEVLARQTAQWGAPLAPTLVMAHCPPLVRGAAGLAVALEKSGQLPAEFRDLISLRVAQLIGCPF